MTGSGAQTLLLDVDGFVIDDARRIDIDRVRSAHTLRFGDDAPLVEYGRPWRLLGLNVGEDLRPDFEPFVLLLRLRHGVGLSPAILETFVAEPRPVPPAGDRAATAEDRPIKVRWIREVSNPAHASRP